MKKTLLFVLFLYFGAEGFSQDMTKFRLYAPAENAEKGIAEAVHTAKKEGKNVFIQIGGNWCIWCARFHDFISGDVQIDSLVKANYVVYHMNYSKENYNGKLLAKYRFPQRFGFPVFLILDQDGELIHTQNSEYLEEGKGYNRDKVIEFFNSWTRRALDPSQYKEK